MAAEIATKHVPLNVVLHVLVESGLVDITASPFDGEAVMRLTLVKRGDPNPATANLAVVFFDDPVHRRMLQRLHIDYGIPIHWFWNPSMVKKTT